MSNFYALLIGINYYQPSKFPNNDKATNLYGCLRDIALVENFLKTKLRIPENSTFKLTSSEGTENRPSESADRLPTYENMVRAFQNLTNIAQPGDQVYIHYSGHGARASTKFPDLKGKDAKDESLCPFNINLPEARYLRDVELAYLIQKMVDKKLIVTVVLDSCHSGGATRGKGGALARGRGEVDSSPRIMESLVATDEELAQTWRSLSSTFTGNPQDGIGWLPDPKGYVLVTACASHELACEKPFEDGFNGLLTYYLVKALRKMELNLTTYDLVYRNILPHLYEKQKPLLLGESSRLVFGCDRLEPVYAVNVTNVDEKTKEVLLDIGHAQAVKKNAELAIYPPMVTDFTDVSQRLAIVQLQEVGATKSRATIEKIFHKIPIEIGAQAVLLDPGNMRLRSNVCLVYDNTTNLTINQEEALERVREALKQDGNNFAVLSDSEQIDYQVAVNAEGAYEIWDAAGNLIKLRPQVLINSDHAAMKLVQRLVHITKYYNILHLENFYSLSPLKGKLEVELFKAPSDYESSDSPEPQSFENPNNPTIQTGEWMFIYVKNNSPQVFYVAILGLMSDWRIEHLYPNSGINFWPLEAGSGVYIPLESYLPDGYAEGADTFKVFATINPTEFRWLALPPLDKPLDPKYVGFRQANKPKTPLEEFLAMMTADNLEVAKLDLRNARVQTDGLEWVTEQRQIKLKRV